MKTLVIIDGNALLHRAFHAIPPLTARNGQVVNAVYGFTTILLRVVRELKPDYMAVTFDAPGKNFRHAMYKEYKATRVKQPQDLYDQLPLIKKVVKGFGFPIFEVEGVEADDVIATIVEKTAVDLLRQFNTLENVYKAVEKNSDVVKKSIAEKLLAHKKEAFQSKELVILKRDVKLDFNLESCKEIGRASCRERG